MVPLVDLLWPILFAAGAIFLVSGVLGRLLPDRAQVFHAREAVLTGIQEVVIQPGDHVLPLAHGRVVLRSSSTYQLAMVPGATLTSRWEGRAAYHLAVNIVTAYLAGLALLPGTAFGLAFRFTTAAALLGYGATSLHSWLSDCRSWRIARRPALESLVCSLVAGCIFAVLWPAA